jgi:maleate isomerase
LTLAELCGTVPALQGGTKIMPSRQGRRRIGLLLPSSNTTQEPELTCIMPDEVTLHVARLPLRPVEPLSAAQIVEDIETESRKLSDADVDAIVLAVMASSVRNEIGYDQELIKRIEAASGTKAATATTAMIQALTVLHIERLVIGAPWSEAINLATAAFLTASGLSVVAHMALGHLSDLEIGRLDEQTAYDMGVAVDRPEAQAVMLACGNWSTLGIVDQLEAAIGKPVLTTNQVSLWAVLRLAGYHAPVFGWGRLLREYMVQII